jgi:polar amino acid transport system permease protein
MIPFDLHYALSILPVLLEASLITIEATVLSFAAALVGGLLLAIGLRSPIAPLRWGLWGAMQFIRSTPLLIQLYFLFFVLPSVGIVLPPLLTGVIGIGLHYCCYIAEVYRAGLESVPRGQWEAASALNYTPAKRLLRIILPQAVPPIIPVLANYMISMFKDTPILASITVVELVQTANILASEKFLYVEPMTLVGLIFLVLSLLASFAISLIQKKVAS